MDEFTNIAIWLVMIYLAINASIVWFDQTDTFQTAGFSIGLTPNDAFTKTDPIVLNLVGIQIDCSTASANPFAYVPCTLAEVGGTFNKLKDQIWNLLTAWSQLIATIFPNNPIAGLIQGIIGPLFGGIAIIGIFVILLRVAGIMRGGS